MEDEKRSWILLQKHNFAAQLALSQSSSVPIQYQPPEMMPPPDLRSKGRYYVLDSNEETGRVRERE